MNVGSLFSGIEGFGLGLERAGMRVVWQCESDDFCRRVLAKHWPDVPCFHDVRDLSSSAGTPPVDVLCGGFPCQDISLAGKGAGITGARSGLWSEYARLVGELRPRYVVVENVSALLARGLGVVLADLAALGYDAEWDCIPASAVGAPHQRDRVWIVAYTERNPVRDEPGRGDGQGRPGARVVADDGAQGLMADAESDGRGSRRPGRPSGNGADGQGFTPEELADPIGVGWESRTGHIRATWGQASLGPEGHPEPARSGWWAVEPDVGRVAHGVPHRVDRLRSLGNSLVPQIAQWIGERIMSHEASA